MDKDLQSVQEARDLVRKARIAQIEYSKWNQEKVDKLVEAISREIENHAENLGRLASEETGFGIAADKARKNLLASRDLLNYIRGMKTIGILGEDEKTGISEIAVPVGVIAGIIPSTNPTSTVIHKALISLKSGNSIVFSPHPSARNCIARTVEIIQAVLRKFGLSEDLLAVASLPSLQGSNELMKEADLILATGGPGMVKAAYSSGTPALGVGSGNVPVFIERTADIKRAVAMIMASKTFDNGTVCASEQAVVTEQVSYARVKAEMEASGCYFLRGEEIPKVKALMERPGGGMNPAVVGRDAPYLAKMAGIEIPRGTRILVCEEEGVGPQYPFSKEKLTQLLGFYTVKDWKEGCERCLQLLKNGGIGHSLAIHSENEEIIREFAFSKPVSRILVNTPSTHGAVGLTTALAPSLTLGCGTVGGSSTSDNVTPLHLINIRRIAWGIKHTELNLESAGKPGGPGGPELTQTITTAVYSATKDREQELDTDLITRLVMEEIRKRM